MTATIETASFPGVPRRPQSSCPRQTRPCISDLVIADFLHHGNSYGRKGFREPRWIRDHVRGLDGKEHRPLVQCIEKSSLTSKRPREGRSREKIPTKISIRSNAIQRPTTRFKRQPTSPIHAHSFHIAKDSDHTAGNGERQGSVVFLVSAYVLDKIPLR